MNWMLLFAIAVLAGIAAAGVIRPFASSRAVTLERLSDPLEDERLSLLRSLRELDDDRAGGLLSQPDYAALRAETEIRAVAVLRALQARDGAGQLEAGIRELRATQPPRGSRVRKHGALPVLATTLAVVVVAVPLLAGVRGRRPDQPITGTAAGPVGGNSSLVFFQQRVLAHPRDVAARLDLAQRYRDMGDIADASKEYLVALQLDPRNAEARANLGYVLYRAGKPAQGLRAVEAALDRAPEYAEAVYFKGVILLALKHPARAAKAFRAYLAAAPFGSRTSEVRRLLDRALKAG